MKLIVVPGQPLRGQIELPGDKSLSHRSALFAALAQGASRLENFLLAGVTRAMLGCLRELGVQWELDGSSLTITGQGMDGLRAPRATLDCGNSGTTLRILAGALAAAGIPAVLDGSPGLRKRPMARIVEPLQAMGVEIESAPGTRAPLNLKGRAPRQRLRALRYDLPVASAQVQTTLLLAGLAADGPTTLTLPGPCRDHTERLLASMGVEIEARPATDRRPITLTLQPPTRPLQPLDFTLPGDFSSAAFLIVAALVTPGSDVTLRGVGLNPTRTGLLDVLERMGASIRVSNTGMRQGEPVGDLNVRYSPLRGVRIDGPLVVRMIDEFPAFAVAAAHASGATTVREAEELRVKESDRVAALVRGLSQLGVAIREATDGFDLDGGEAPEGGTARSNGDHRLAMTFAVAGLAASNPVTVHGAELIAESFPGFVEALQTLGAEVHVASEPSRP